MTTDQLNADLDRIRDSVGKEADDAAKLPLTKGILRTIAETISAVGRAAGRGDKELAQRLEEAEARISALETSAACSLEYVGVYEHGKSYRRNLAVTHNGNLWISMTETRQAPGTTRDWRLAVRAGRDALK